MIVAAFVPGTGSEMGFRGLACSLQPVPGYGEQDRDSVRAVRRVVADSFGAGCADGAAGGVRGG